MAPNIGTFRRDLFKKAQEQSDKTKALVGKLPLFLRDNFAQVNLGQPLPKNLLYALFTLDSILYHNANPENKPHPLSKVAKGNLPWKNSQDLYKWTNTELANVFAKTDSQSNLNSLKNIVSLVGEKYGLISDTLQFRRDIEVLISQIDRKMASVGGTERERLQKIRDRAIAGFPFSSSDRFISKNSGFAAISFPYSNSESFNLIRDFFEARKEAYVITKSESWPGSKQFVFIGDKFFAAFDISCFEALVCFGNEFAGHDDKNLIAAMKVLVPDALKKIFSIHFYSAKGAVLRSITSREILDVGDCFFGKKGCVRGFALDMSLCISRDEHELTRFVDSANAPKWNRLRKHIELRGGGNFLCSGKGAQVRFVFAELSDDKKAMLDELLPLLEGTCLEEKQPKIAQYGSVRLTFFGK